MADAAPLLRAGGKWWGAAGLVAVFALFVTSALALTPLTTPSSSSSPSSSSIVSLLEKEPQSHHAASGTVDGGGACEGLLYASTCVEHGCAFCCARPIGRQCMAVQAARNASMCPSGQALLPSDVPPPAPTAAPNNATLSDFLASMQQHEVGDVAAAAAAIAMQPLRQRATAPSCDALCHRLGDSCESCTAAPWCAYCDSTKTCVGAREYCRDDAFIIDCNGSGPTLPLSYFTILLYVCIAATTFLLLVVVAGCLRRFHMTVTDRAGAGGGGGGGGAETEANVAWLRRHLERLRGGAPHDGPVAGSAGGGPAAGRAEERANAAAEGAPLLGSEAASPAINDRPQHQQEAQTRAAAAASPATSAATALRSDGRVAAAAAAADTERAPNDADDADDGAEEEEEAEAAPLVVAELEDGEERVCQICLDSRPTVVFLPCYHAYCCAECSEQIRPNRRRRGAIACPFCRARIVAMLDLRSLWRPPTASTNSGSSRSGGGGGGTQEGAVVPGSGRAEVREAQL